MKPFNLNKAISGAKVLTRDRREVTELKSFTVGMFNVYGVLDGAVSKWTESGRWISNRTESKSDLFMAETTHVIYSLEIWPNSCPDWYNSKDELIAAHPNYENETCNIIVKVEWQETKPKPFDLEKALAGAKVITKDKTPVQRIHLFDINILWYRGTYF